MSQPDKIIIEFVTKKEHQKRKEYKHETWFALSNSVMENPDYCDLTPLEFKALIYLYCQCSKAKWKPVAISYRHAEKLHDIKRVDLDRVLSILLANQKVIVHEPNQAVIRQPSGSDQAATDRREIINKEKKQREEDLESSASKAIFEIHHELRGEGLDDVLKFISKAAQDRWVKRYKDTQWIRSKLLLAIDFHQTRAEELGEPISNWGSKLNNWLMYEKDKPQADKYDFIPDDEVSA